MGLAWLLGTSMLPLDVQAGVKQSSFTTGLWTCRALTHAQIQHCASEAAELSRMPRHDIVPAAGLCFGCPWPSVASGQLRSVVTETDGNQVWLHRPAGPELFAVRKHQLWWELRCQKLGLSSCGGPGPPAYQPLPAECALLFQVSTSPESALSKMREVSGVPGSWAAQPSILRR